MARRRTRRTSVLAALLFELATLLGIVGLAQPSWSRLLVEAVSQISQAAFLPDVEARVTPTAGYPLDAYR